MKSYFILLGLIFGILLRYETTAQEPIIVGDSLLCPEGFGTLMTTDTFESYQWFRRYFGSSDTVILEGETSRSLDVNYFDFAASYMIVEVLVEDEKILSDEFFVDGYVFAPATVISSGDFTIGEEGNSVLCPDDTMFFTLSNPYTVNIEWYRNGQLLEGETDQELTVTEPGIYNVIGAPELCPDFFQGPGVPLIVVPCATTSADDYELNNAITIFPVPATNVVCIQGEDLNREHYSIYDLQGKCVDTGQLSDTRQLDISAWQEGVYILHLGTSHQTYKIVKHR